MWCIVNLPNGTQQAVKWDPKAIGQECLEKVIHIKKSLYYFTINIMCPFVQNAKMYSNTKTAKVMFIHSQYLIKARNH